MGIGVVEAVVEDHLQTDRGPAPRDFVGVDSRLGQPLGFRKLDPFEPFHHQYATCGKSRIRAGKVGRRVIAEVAGELLHVALLARKIQLAPHCPLILGRDGRRPVVAEVGEPLGQLGQPHEDVHVDGHLFLDVGMEHLDHHRLARVERRAMDLTDRGRGHRLRLELGEERLDRLAQLRLNDLAHHGRRIGRHVLLEVLELLGQLHSHQVGPGAEDLAQLDERRAKLGQRQPQAGFPGVSGNGRPAPGLQQILGEIRPQSADPGRQLVLAQHRQYLIPAAQMPINLRDRVELHRASAVYEADSLLSAVFFSPPVKLASVSGNSTPPMSFITCIIGGSVRAMLWSQPAVALVPF